MSQVRFELYGPESEKARKYWCDAVDEISDAVVELNEWSARDDVVLVPGSHDGSAVVSLDDTARSSRRGGRYAALSSTTYRSPPAWRTGK